MKTMAFVILAFLGLSATVTQVSGLDCWELARGACKNHVNANTTYCGTDGKHYKNLCAIWTASCSNQSLSIKGTGPHCDPITTPYIPTTTQPPLSPFTQALFKAITHGIDDRLVRTYKKHTPADKAKLIFTKQDHKNKVYIRNTECWAYGLDLTCASPWNSEHGIRKAGTLVSPRHAVWARHYNIPVNTTIRFVDADNIVIDRKIVATKTVDPSAHSFFGRDIVVGLLDRDVPSTIGYARVLPRNLTTFRPDRSHRLPTLSTDFEEKALVDDFRYISGTSVSLLSPSIFSLRHIYYEPKIVGDSGNPTFFVINNDLVLIFVFTTGGAGGGTPLVHYYDDINRIMGELGGGYRLTDVNLNTFLHTGETLPGAILG